MTAGTGVGDCEPAGAAVPASPDRYVASVLWVPSQNGAPLVCLHWHSQASPDFPAVNFLGANDVPLCEPSQNGWLADRPQAQNQ
jgi:hypothetical protein